MLIISVAPDQLTIESSKQVFRGTFTKDFSIEIQISL